MRKIIIVTLLVAVLLPSCVMQSEYDKLKSENEVLKTQVDELLNGAERLKAEINKLYEEKNYVLTKERIQKLFEVHPQENEDSQIKAIEKNVEQQLLIAKKRKEEEEKDKIRLENLNNTGIWQVNYYVDDFGEPTKEGYIRNKYTIRGTFSNTATENSKLDVKFLISEAYDVDMMLYEYAGNNPVKAYSSKKYKVLIQDKEGKRMTLYATNSGDRLNFNTTSSRKVHNKLLKGGRLKFKIIEVDTPTTQYFFEIEKADWYENAYRLLKES